MGQHPPFSVSSLLRTSPQFLHPGVCLALLQNHHILGVIVARESGIFSKSFQISGTEIVSSNPFFCTNSLNSVSNDKNFKLSLSEIA